jgi:aminoglycoside 3-N-acetyltransferase
MNEQSEERVITRTEAAIGSPVTLSSLVTDLNGLGLPAHSPVIVHSSLSALGWVAGGAMAVVSALVACFGDPTVVVPTQSGDLSDPAQWSRPPVPAHWHEVIRAEMPAYDELTTVTRGVGRVPEVFRTHPKAVRGPHPTVSFAAIGPRAADVVTPHPLDQPFGEESPLRRLYDLDATVLLLGVDHGSNTSLHLAEHRATWPGKPLGSTSGAPVLRDGQRVWATFVDDGPDDDDFDVIGEAFRLTGGEHIGTVGCADVRWCSMRRIVDFAEEWMTTNRT